MGMEIITLIDMHLIEVGSVGEVHCKLSNANDSSAGGIVAHKYV